MDDKRVVGGGCRWKARWFKIQDRVLYCYNAVEGRLRRAIPLEGTEVEIVPNPRYVRHGPPSAMVAYHTTCPSIDLDQEIIIIVLSS